MEVDSDWAQCPRTRRSTGGGLVFLGSHLVDSYCGQHQNVALSSGEAELHDMVNGTAHGLFLKHVLEEMGVQGLIVKVGTDSAAALGISHRLGCGRVRHLEGKQLWIQEKVRSGEVKPIKIKTTVNRGDLMTKPLDPERHFGLGQHSAAIGANGPKRAECVDGRHAVGSLARGC